MNIRDRILRVAIDAEALGKRATADALYLIVGLMEPDGSHCQLAEFMVDLIDEEPVMDWAGDFDVHPDVMGAVARGVGLSLKLPPVAEIPAEEYALTWPILED